MPDFVVVVDADCDGMLTHADPDSTTGVTLALTNLGHHAADINVRNGGGRFTFCLEPGRSVVATGQEITADAYHGGQIVIRVQF